MPRPLRALFLAFLLLAASGAPALAEAWLPPLPTAGPLSASDKAAVTRAYQSATRAFARRRYREALTHADRAFERLPNASTALVRATILDKLDRPADAFKTYLLAADLGPTPEEQPLIDAGLAEHGAALGVGWVAIAATPDDATLFVDGTVFSGARTVGLPAGPHELLVESAGYLGQRLPLDVAAGVGQRLLLTLERAPLALDPGGAGPGAGDGLDPGLGVHRSDDDGRTLTAWLVTGGGVVALLAGLGTHLAAADAADDAARWAAPDATLSADARRSRYDDAVSKKDTLETTAWVMYGVGAAAVVTGLVLLLDGDDADAPPPLSLAPAPGGAQVSLHATF